MNRVLACFGDRGNPWGVIRRLATEWAGYYGLPAPMIGPHTQVRAEVWNGPQVRDHLHRLARLQPRLLTTDRPRRLDGPLVLIDFGQGRIGQLDGRRRANVWQHGHGEHEVLILCAS